MPAPIECMCPKPTPLTPPTHPPTHPRLQHTSTATPYAHRDIKPHNVLLRRKASEGASGSESFAAVLMDFGSARPARVEVRSRNRALKVQEEAEAHSTATYRPPELFDTPSECTIDERTDVWSLGCLLYYMCYKESPFEYAVSEAGGSLALAVLSGKVAWDDCGDLKPLADLAKTCMAPANADRPYVQEVVKNVTELIDAM